MPNTQLFGFCDFCTDPEIKKWRQPLVRRYVCAKCWPQVVETSTQMQQVYKDLVERWPFLAN